MGETVIQEEKAKSNLATTTHSTCYMCTTNCPITVVSEGPEITSVVHPPCVRAEAMEEQRDSEHRLREPMIRGREGDPWRTVTWADAVSHTASELLRIRDAHGPQSIAFMVGYTKEARPYLQRLAHAFGSPHYITESSCCFASGSVGAKVTLGQEYGFFFNTSRFKQPETKCRLIWSNNPTDSLIPYASHHLLKEADSMPTIVVDPRRTRLAETASVHLMLRPGTDGALALGLAHVILREGLQDDEFLAQHAHGVEAYKDYVQEFTPERTSEITGIPAETIVEAALLYGRAKPAQITVSQEAIVQHGNGLQNYRAVILLAALCGYIDIAGGNVAWDSRLREKNVSLHGELAGGLPTIMGGEEFPVFTSNYTEGQAMLLPDYIEQGKIKAVFSMGTNLMMWPNSNRFAEALSKLELFTACDFFANPTVDAANVFLPAATSLERQALIVAPIGKVQYRPAAVPPRGEARGDTEMLFDMAEALGLGDMFWNGDIHASFDERLEPTGLSFDDLPRDGKSIKVELEPRQDRSYRQNGFGTPTGKVEFDSTTLSDAGYDGLPTYREPHLSPQGSPETAEIYPLVLTSGGRSNNFTHSQGRMLKTLRKREPDPRLQINPEDARARGIEDGDWLEISAPTGSIEMVAWVTDIMAPGVVHGFHGWAEANINSLVPDGDALDPISGYPPFKSCLCQVEKQSA